MLEICVGTEKGVENWSKTSLCMTGFGTYIRILEICGVYFKHANMHLLID
jgi:hypothetical protein